MSNVVSGWRYPSPYLVFEIKGVRGKVLISNEIQLKS
jgi:hypothetical protein